MNAAVAPGARPLLVEIDWDNRRRFDFIGIAPFDLLRRLAVSAKRGCRRGRSLLVRSAVERLKSGACKLVRSAVDSVFRPVGRTIPLRCESGSRMHKLVGVARFRVPDRSAADAADLPPVRGQACQIHIIGRGAGRTDNQHRRIMARQTSPRHYRRSVNELETMRPGAGTVL